MVEVVIDPRLDDVFDVGEVDYHASMVGFFGLDVYFNPAVMAVQVPAFTFVFQEPMSVAKIDDSCYFVGHRLNTSDVPPRVYSDDLTGD